MEDASVSDDCQTSWRVLDADGIAFVGDCPELLALVPPGGDYRGDRIDSRRRRAWVCPVCGQVFRTSVYRLAVMRSFEGCPHCGIDRFNGATVNGWLSMRANRDGTVAQAQKVCALRPDIHDVLESVYARYDVERGGAPITLDRLAAEYSPARPPSVVLVCRECGRRRRCSMSDIVGHATPWFRCSHEADRSPYDMLRSLAVRADGPLDDATLTDVRHGVGGGYDVALRCPDCSHSWSMPVEVMSAHSATAADGIPDGADPTSMAWRLCPACCPGGYSIAERACFPEAFPNGAPKDPKVAPPKPAALILPGGNVVQVSSTEVVSDYETGMNAMLSELTMFPLVTNAHGVLPGGLELDAWIPALGIAFEWDKGDSRTHEAARRLVKDRLAARLGIRVYHVRPSDGYRPQLVRYNIEQAVRKAEATFLARLSQIAGDDTLRPTE